MSEKSPIADFPTAHELRCKQRKMQLPIEVFQTIKAKLLVCQETFLVYQFPKKVNVDGRDAILFFLHEEGFDAEMTYRLAESGTGDIQGHVHSIRITW